MFPVSDSSHFQYEHLSSRFISGFRDEVYLMMNISLYYKSVDFYRTPTLIPCIAYATLKTRNGLTFSVVGV